MGPKVDQVPGPKLVPTFGRKMKKLEKKFFVYEKVGVQPWVQGF